jgi:cation:H+ antiporter
VLVVAVVIGLLLMRQTTELAGEKETLHAQSTVSAVAMFCGAAAVILVAAPVLVWAAEEISEITGLAESFVGVLMLAIATSLPELAASSAAVRMGSVDLAVATLYGSNAMNMGLLVWLDVIYTKAPLLESADISIAMAGLVAVLLMMIGLASMVLRAERRSFPFDPAAVLILIGYALGLMLTWSVST